MHPCEEINLPQTIGDVFPKSGIGYKSGKKNCDLIIEVEKKYKWHCLELVVTPNVIFAH